MRPCPNCGQDVAPTSDRFCPHCGAMLPWARSATSNGTGAAATPSQQPYQAPQTTYRPQQSAAASTSSYAQPQTPYAQPQPQPQTPYTQPRPQTPYTQPQTPYAQADPSQGAFLGGVQGGNLPAAPLQRASTPVAPLGGAGPALNTLLGMGRFAAGSRSRRRSVTPTRIALAIVAVLAALWLIGIVVSFVLHVVLPIVFVLAVLFLVYQYGIKRRLGRRLP